MIDVDNELIEHMSSPNNYGRIDNPDSIGIGQNPQNNEKVLIYINIDKKDKDFYIKEIKFEAIACMTTVVAGSIITKEALGLSFDKVEELIAVTLGMLDSVPPEQAACSEIVALALKAAVDGYLRYLENGNKDTLIYNIQQSCSPQFENSNQGE